MNQKNLTGARRAKLERRSRPITGEEQEKSMCVASKAMTTSLPHTHSALYTASPMKSFAGLVEQMGIATRKWQQPLGHVPVQSHLSP